MITLLLTIRANASICRCFIRLGFGLEAFFQIHLRLSDELAGVLGIALGYPMAEEKRPLSIAHRMELFTFFFAP